MGVITTTVIWGNICERRIIYAYLIQAHGGGTYLLDLLVRDARSYRDQTGIDADRKI